MNKKKKYNKTETGVQKCAVALFWKGKIITGHGTFQAIRDLDDNVRFTVFMQKEFPKNL